MLNLESIRSQFPALQQTDNHKRPYIFFDGPGGTQVPRQVIEAMQEYLITANANSHGHFVTSQRSDGIIGQARLAMADFLNAPTPQEIVFGNNMTSLTFNLSRAIGSTLQAGDEVIVTRLDHDANVSPWTSLAERGVTVRWVDFDVEDCRLNLDHLASLLTARTKLVAVGYASNAVGTINPIKQIAEMVHQQTPAQVWVDAVHYAPHGPIDVQELGCDFLVCSAYKFFGPHVGVLWGRQALLEQLPAYKVRPAGDAPPDKFEVGTLNHEGIAGVTAAVSYLAGLGQQYGGTQQAELSPYTGRRRQLKRAMHAIVAYEQALFADLLKQLQAISGVRVYGITNPAAFAERCPTVSFTKAGRTPAEITKHLGQQSIFAWHGHYYALNAIERLGLAESGGAVRVGLVHYNTQEEVERFVEALAEL